MSVTSPSVSCILPCGYGDKYINDAIACWSSQEYEGHCELVILDNNDVPLMTPELQRDLRPNVKYTVTTRKPVGALRNEGIRQGSGDVICIWDEDDWSAPNRVTEQVTRLLASGKSVTGWHNVLYWDEATGETYKYYYSPDRPHPPYAMGASHCFFRSWWEKHPYVMDGVEDRIFSDEALHAGQLDSCDAGRLYVARIHDSNVIRKNRYLGHHKQWPAVERSTFPQEFLRLVSGRMQ